MSKTIFKVLKSFTFATEGIVTAFGERNMRVHGIATVLVLFLAIFFRISLLEWVLIIMLIGWVMMAEMINTSIEAVCNNMRDELGLPYKSSKRARDVAAGAVLVSAIAAALVGGIIFFPRIWSLIYLATL